MHVGRLSKKNRARFREVEHNKCSKFKRFVVSNNLDEIRAFQNNK